MKISVIIPVYNVRPYLERCVQSVLRQTHKDLEIILVDDGSTDGSDELCDHLASSDQRIRVIHQENQGLSGARNTGIYEATGMYIVFLDSDDMWLCDDGLENILKGCRSQVDLIIFKSVDIWKNDYRVFSKDYDLGDGATESDAKTAFTHLVKNQQLRMSACFLLVRRELLLEHDIIFPIGYISEDVQWSIHLWQFAQIVVIKNINFYGYYHRGNSLSTTTSIHVYESYDKMLSFWKEECNKGCANETIIRIYLTNLWINRGYCYHMLDKADRPEAIRILKRHTDLLQYAISTKGKIVARLVKLTGLKNTVIILGIYWRLRTWITGQSI